MMSKRWRWIGAASLMFVLGIAGSALAGIVTPPVPELDPSSATGGVAVLIGMGLLVLERFRRR